MLLGRLTDALHRRLDCPDARVMFDPAYASKLRFKHRLEARHFGMMPITFDLGLVFQDRPGALSFIYDDVHVFGKSFYLVLKTTGERHEIWVMSFRRIREADKRSLLRKHPIIRQHK